MNSYYNTGKLNSNLQRYLGRYRFRCQNADLHIPCFDAANLEGTCFLPDWFLRHTDFYQKECTDPHEF